MTETFPARARTEQCLSCRFLLALSRHACVVFVALVFQLEVLQVTAQSEESNWPWIDPQGIPGVAVLVGGGELPAGVRDAMQRVAGGEAARLVVIPTADEAVEAALEASDPAQLEAMTRPWLESGFRDVQILSIQGEAPQESQLQLLEQASAIWFEGGQQRRLASRIIGTPWEEALMRFQQRGGLIGGTSAGAAFQSRVMIASGQTEPEIEVGLDLIPGSIIDQHFSERSRQERLRKAVADHPDRFGLGLDEGTAVLIQGRTMVVTGTGAVTVMLASGAGRDATERKVKSGESLDLIALRRSARARAAGTITLREPTQPEVAAGTLVIVGGGGLPREVLQAFIDAAGGPEARIVILPTAEPPRPDESPEAEAAREGIAGLFREAGVAEVKVLTQRTRDAVSSPEFLDAVNRATGIWFGGGRQWRFVDTYEGTPAEDALSQVLARGGVIGGSSAGATIQGDYLARGNPLGNLDIMAEGYERGFAYLPGVAIDQHFTERGRLPDLISLVKAEPRYLGIGIDEATAIVVSGSTAEILGRGGVTFVRASESDEPLTVSLKSGQRYDLVTGESQDKVSAPEPPSSESSSPKSDVPDRS